jgi:polysaccharide pyruvyl transferase CsaB
MKTKPAKLLLSGYWGFGNFGDEAILRVMVDEWRRRRPDDVLTVLSAVPAATIAEYGVKALPRAEWRTVTGAVRASDVVVSGGGGLLQTATSLRSLMYYVGIIREAQSANRAAAIFAQGVGPLDFLGKQIVRRACCDIELACVRDEGSATLLRSLLPRVNVRLAADPVLLAKPVPSVESEAMLAREGLRDLRGDLVAVVVRHASYFDRILPQIAALVDRLASRHGAQVVLLPLQVPDDADAATQVIRRCKSTPVLMSGGYDLPEMAAIIGRCTAVVSMRLHALIVAAKLAVPFIAVPYDPKVGALMQNLAYPQPALVPGAKVDELVDGFWEQRARLSAHLAAATPPLAARAMLAFDWLQELVERVSLTTESHPL